VPCPSADGTEIKAWPGEAGNFFIPKNVHASAGKLLVEIL
jgi:hypothetical protein